MGVKWQLLVPGANMRVVEANFRVVRVNMKVLASCKIWSATPSPWL